MPQRNIPAQKAAEEAKTETKIAKVLAWVEENVPGEKWSLCKAAEKFGLKKMRLTNCAHSGCLRREAHVAQQGLLPEEETAIAKFALAPANCNFPITLKHLREHTNFLLHL
jgi:hypothetical protein